MNINKYKYWLIAIGIFILLNMVFTLLTWMDIRLVKQEMAEPKRVEFTSLGVVHSWPVDNYNTKIVSAK
jgi:hypothetical protein